jgi:hypothetical protein
MKAAAPARVPTDDNSQSPAAAAPPATAQPAASPPQPASNDPNRTADTSLPASAPPVKPETASSPTTAKSTVGTRPTKQPVPVPPIPATPAVKSGNPPAAATLDLGGLEARLRDTHAIGVFTKLSLKNQVDDLLDEFRVFYRASNKNPTAELRQHYDVLLIKVLGLLRDGDPTLAAAVSTSREAIWGILSDPDKFAKL